jgi:hypothetical protein
VPRCHRTLGHGRYLGHRFRVDELIADLRALLRE